MGAERNPERTSNGWSEPAIADHLRRLQRRLDPSRRGAPPPLLCSVLIDEAARLDNPGLPLLLRYRAFALLDRSTRALERRFEGDLESGEHDPALWHALPDLLATLGAGFASVARALERATEYRPLFLPSLYLALSSAGRSALSAAALHLPPPVGTLLLVNRIFLSAENLRILATPITLGEGRLDTLGHAFRRLQLLLLSDPYRLGGGESGRLLRLLSPAAELARVVPWSPSPPPGARFLLDLEADRCAHLPAGPPAGPVERLRLLDLSLTCDALRELLGSPASSYTPAEARLLEGALARLADRPAERPERSGRDAVFRGVIGLAPAARWLEEGGSAPLSLRLLDESTGGMQFSVPSEALPVPLAVGELVVTQRSEGGAEMVASVIRWYRRDGMRWRIGVEKLGGIARAARVRSAAHDAPCGAILLAERGRRRILVPAGCGLSPGERILYRVEEVSLAARIEEIRPLSTRVETLHIVPVAGEA